MKWIHDLQFIAAVPMPEELVDQYGTTINGMWADSESMSDQAIDHAHAKGRRLLFSVPLIALTPKVYSVPENRDLIDEACLDIYGNTSLVPWYYWEAQKVYSICFYSSKFRHYLLERCIKGIKRGFDVVDLDEINTSLGLMNTRPGDSGFCPRCLERFRKYVRQTPSLDPSLVEMDDPSLRQKLREDAALYEIYHRFHDQEAYRVVTGFVEELRAIARQYNPDFAITANLAYLGNLVPEQGDLWGLMWGELIDFVMMENVYQPVRGGPHLLLPRGKFSAWYRLGSAFSSHAPNWICPSINVPKQMAGEKRTTYYTLMFLEAYANGGRWGYYWWPGVDVETRVKATAPEEIIDYTHLLKSHRQYFEHVTSQNSLAILYLNSAMRERPQAHFKYLALAQALIEKGHQFDVIYAGDNVYTPDALDYEQLCRYKAVLVPESGFLTPTQAETLNRYALEQQGDLIQFVQNPAAHGLPVGSIYDETALFHFWDEYQDIDREQIAACVNPRAARPIHTTHNHVNVIRWTKAGQTVLHLLNYNYDAVLDQVAPAEKVVVRCPWEQARTPELRWISLSEERLVDCRLENGEVVFEIPRLDLYGFAVLS